MAMDGSQGPLPKQEDFLYSTLDVSGPKYIAYIGGIGSGKTLIGCITLLAMAVTHPGDYLLTRQYLPELKITTLKTFLEVCPPDLIVEHRVADGIIKIRSQGGRISNIFLRPLEEPDKLRSLNLSGFYIDEASQVSEEAFILLQGRLRGQGLRKGIVTSNPNGHDWLYRWFYKQDHIKLDSVKNLFKLIKAPSTENKHLPTGYVASMLATWSEERVKREIYGDFDSFEGQVYTEFSEIVHVVRPFRVPEEWTRVIGVDHGYRNPSAWIFGAVDYDGNIFIYRELYEKEMLIKDICAEAKRLIGKDKIEAAYIDPSTRARRGTTGRSDFDEYVESLPSGFPLLMANNEVMVGIDRVKSFLRVNEKTNKPQLFIFSTCKNVVEEMAQYRWQELGSGSMGKINEKEAPVKNNDHAMDALRYLIMSRPETRPSKDDYYRKVHYNSLEGALHRDIQQLKEPKIKDPFGD